MSKIWCLLLLFSQDFLLCMEQNLLQNRATKAKYYGALPTHNRQSSLDSFQEQLKGSIASSANPLAKDTLMGLREPRSFLHNNQEAYMTRGRRLGYLTLGLGLLFFSTFLVGSAVAVLQMNDWELGRLFMLWIIITGFFSPIICGVFCVCCCQMIGLCVGGNCICSAVRGNFR